MTILIEALLLKGQINLVAGSIYFIWCWWLHFFQTKPNDYIKMSGSRLTRYLIANHVPMSASSLMYCFTLPIPDTDLQDLQHLIVNVLDTPAKLHKNEFAKMR